MEDRIRLAIGCSDFRSIISRDCYYIDKTSSISSIIRDGSDAIQFTRPRRFGKTTFQSMLCAFFDIREDSRDIFSGLDIMDDKEAVDNWMNRYPVIYLSFKDIDGLELNMALDVLKGKLSKLYQGYGFIDTVGTYEERIAFRNIRDGKASISEIRRSLEILAGVLYAHYGKKIIFLLDEYDVPLDKAEKKGYYTEMLDVIRAMLLPVLKDCPYTAKGIITGCLRISKESLFTGLNNLAAYSLTADEYSSAFGFTESEVDRLLKDAGLEDKADVFRKWYDGYAIGNEHIYTPWDVISYARRLQVNIEAEPENYWANSSGNDVMMRKSMRTTAR